MYEHILTYIVYLYIVYMYIWEETINHILASSNVYINIEGDLFFSMDGSDRACMFSMYVHYRDTLVLDVEIKGTMSRELCVIFGV